MTTKAGNLGKVEAKFVLQPVHRITRPSSEDLNKVVASEVTSLKQWNERPFHANVKEKNLRIAWCHQRIFWRYQESQPLAAFVCLRR